MKTLTKGLLGSGRPTSGRQQSPARVVQLSAVARRRVPSPPPRSGTGPLADEAGPSLAALPPGEPSDIRQFSSGGVRGSTPRRPAELSDVRPMSSRGAPGAAARPDETFGARVVRGAIGIGAERGGTQERLRTVRAVFRKWDRNGDGLMSEPDFVRLLQAMDANLTPTDVRALFLAADANHDGCVNYDEFLDWLSQGSVPSAVVKACS